MELQRRWQKLWGPSVPEGEINRWRDNLFKRYSEPHRHYHTLNHIRDCFVEFDAPVHFVRIPRVVELAIWFHDVIYDPRASDNEEQSADFSRQCLEALEESQNAAAVSRLILATKTHDPSTDPDARLLVDVDLSIFGKPPEQFWKYETQVREEYDWVPAVIFNSRRADILDGFLARARIYHTDHFFDKFELQARANLQASIKKLRG